MKEKYGERDDEEGKLAPFVGEKRKFLSKMKTPFSDSWRVNFLSQFFFRSFILSHLCSIVSFPRKLRKWRMKEVSRVLYLRLFSKLDFLFFSVYICEVVQNGFESLFRSFSVVCIVISLVVNSQPYGIAGGVASSSCCFDSRDSIFSHEMSLPNNLKNKSNA